MKNSFLSLVAVRLKSKRLKEKALANLYKKPLILRLTERISQAKIPSEIIWCTSKNKNDNKLETLAKLNNISLYRGSELNVLSRFLSVAKKRKADGIIRITGDNPLTDPRIIDLMIRFHIKNKLEYTYTDDLPLGTTPEIISFKALEKCNKVIKDKKYTEYLTFFLKNPKYFKIKKYQVKKKLNRKDIRLTVDTKEDLEVLKKIYNKYKGYPPNLDKIILWLDKNKNIKEINKNISRNDMDFKKYCKVNKNINFLK